MLLTLRDILHMVTAPFRLLKLAILSLSGLWSDLCTLRDGMKTQTEKQFQRIENKKKKMAAFLEIAKLNDKDREEKLKLRSRASESSDSDQKPVICKTKRTRGESKKKRIKTHHIECEAEVPQVIELEPIPAIPSVVQLEPVRYGPSGKEMLHGEELKRLKTEMRERKKRLLRQPLFRLRVSGEQASINVKDTERTPLFFSDIQHLLLYSLLGDRSPYSPFAWCQFEKHNRVSQTIVLVIEGLSLYDYLAYESCFPCIAATFPTKLEVITPSAYNGNFAEELALIPMTDRKEQCMIRRYGSIEAVLRADGNVFRVLRSIFPILESDETPSTGSESNASRGVKQVYVKPVRHTNDRFAHSHVPTQTVLSTHPRDRFPRTHLIMSPSQLIDENFPVPLKGALQKKYASFTMTKDMYKEVTELSPMFALDCEMCMTTAKMLELTRISIVNENLQCLYDELVQPYNRITNYLTQYSGITPGLMAGVTKRLEMVQEDIRHLLPPDAILVGQSLNSDLQALKMMHPYVIDTSVIYNVTCDYRRKTKLSKLSLKFLGEEIQTGRQGHCSTEDSEACMKLVQLKLANSLAFGDTILAGNHPEYCSLPQPAFDAGLRFVKFDDVENPSTAPREGQSQVSQPVAENNCHLASTMFSYLNNHEKSVAIVSTARLLEQYIRYTRVPCDYVEPTTKTPLDTVASCSDSQVFADVCKAAASHTFTIGHARCEEQASTDKEARFREIDAACGTVWNTLAMNGLCVVVFGGRKGGANGACFLQVKKAEYR